MAGPLDLTGQNIEDTYQRIIQTDGSSLYDGTGSLYVVTAVAAPAGPINSIQFNDSGATSGSGDFTFNKITNVVSLTGSINAEYGFTGSLFGTAATASNTPNALVTGSITGNVITLTKGNGTSFNLTVDTGSFTQIDTSSFVTTSSFNNFTSSYNTGSFTGSFTGIFNGTASWAQNAVTASFAPDYVLNSATSSFIVNSQTSSFVQTSVTSSMLAPYVLSSQTSSMSVATASFVTGSNVIGIVNSASYAANGGVTQIIAGTNVTISPTNGLGTVTINSSGGGGGSSATSNLFNYYNFI